MIDSNRAVCVQPYINAEGYIPFEISVNSGYYTWKGKYFVETPATAEEKITFVDTSVHETYPKEIKINWNRFNLTTNLAASIQISLYGYKEVTTHPQFMYIDLLEVSFGQQIVREFILQVKGCYVVIDHDNNDNYYIPVSD